MEGRKEKRKEREREEGKKGGGGKEETFCLLSLYQPLLSTEGTAMNKALVSGTGIRPPHQRCWGDSALDGDIPNVLHLQSVSSSFLCLLLAGSLFIF